MVKFSVFFLEFKIAFFLLLVEKVITLTPNPLVILWWLNFESNLPILGLFLQFICSLGVCNGWCEGSESWSCSVLLLHLWRRGGHLSQPGAAQEEDPQPEHLFSKHLLRLQVGVKTWRLLKTYCIKYQESGIKK